MRFVRPSTGRFASPSVINNSLNTGIVVPTDLSALAPLLPPTLRPLVSQPFPLAVQAVGSQIPIGSTPQQELTKESLTAYEVAYTGTFHERTTAGVAVYVNDLNNSIKFTPLPPSLDPYTATSPPPGWLLPPTTLSILAQQGIFLPRTGFTYLNLGPLRQKGIELSLDHRVSRAATAFVNYSWQAKPTVLEDPHPYPLQQLALPPTNRVNVGFNVDGARWLGSGSVNYVDKALWTDVLTSAYFGYSEAYTLVNASVGMKWADGRITTLVKATNLLNHDIQQHVFGDLIKRSVDVRSPVHAIGCAHHAAQTAIRLAHHRGGSAEDGRSEMRKHSAIAAAMILVSVSVLRAAPRHRRTAARGRPTGLAE